MQDKKYVICGNASAKGISDDPKNDTRLRLSGVQGEGNITLRVEDIHSKMFSSVPTKFHDLLEIATYVYSADQVIVRRADDVDNFGDGWRRDLHFVVPVRNPEFWSSAEVKDKLMSTLGFLSDDNYEFTFVKLDQEHAIQDYLEFNDAQTMYGKPEQVVMFSGGLDSLAGALDEVLSQKRRVVLVTHKATPKLNTRHKTLQDLLAKKAGDNVPHHISVRPQEEAAEPRIHAAQPVILVRVHRRDHRQDARPQQRALLRERRDQPEPARLRTGGRRARDTHDAPTGDAGLSGNPDAGGRRAVHGRKPVHLEDQG